MAEVEVMVKRVECTKLSEKNEEDSEVIFNVSASLAESERNPGWLAIKFDIDLETQPSVAKLSLGGLAIVRGESEEIQTLITAKDQNSVPPLFMKIYQKVYSIMYLLCVTLKIPQPAPGLLKTTNISSAKDSAKEVVQPLQS